MSVNKTCAISSWISFLTSAAIWIHMEIPDATILSSRLPRVERKARRPSTQRSKQPSKVHAGLRCVGDSSSDETGRSALVDERACQLAVFSGKLPSMEAEIDCKLQSNS